MRRRRRRDYRDVRVRLWLARSCRCITASYSYHSINAITNAPRYGSFESRGLLRQSSKRSFVAFSLLIDFCFLCPDTHHRTPRPTDIWRPGTCGIHHSYHEKPARKSWPSNINVLRRLDISPSSFWSTCFPKGDTR